MRIGLRDVRHFAIIAGAGGAGLVATMFVYSAIRGPDVRYHRGVTIKLMETSGEVVVQPPGLVVDPTSGELRARVGWKRKPGRGGFVYPARPGLLAEEKPVIYVDGARVRSLGFLRPENIESIEVFKGLKSKERFGHEGESGVIEVVTKSGESGKKDKSGKAGKSGQSGKKDWPGKKEGWPDKREND